MKTNKFFSSFVKLFFSSVLRWASFFSIRKIGKRGQKPYWTPSWRAPAAASFENYYYAILVFFMEKKTSLLLVAKQTLFFSQKRLKKTNTEVSGSGEGFLDNFFLVIMCAHLHLFCITKKRWKILTSPTMYVWNISLKRNMPMMLSLFHKGIVLAAPTLDS